MTLQQIGFYTLSDERAMYATPGSPLQRCELIITGRCNFKCLYCRSVGGEDLPLEQALHTLQAWVRNGLKNVRFSGGEPTLHPNLVDMVAFCKANGVQRIAVSTNGSMPARVYDRLIEAGVNDFSVSLDACCAEDGDHMAGGVKGAWNRVVESIRHLSSKVYTTVGVVLTEDNASKLNDIIKFADSLGVSDIRVIPAAQVDNKLRTVHVDAELLGKYPILNYRIQNVAIGRQVRGLSSCDSDRCGLVLDDMAVMGTQHYPCIIYMREGGKPIGTVGPEMRNERDQWFREHNTHQDPICKKNCLDVCVQHNTTFQNKNLYYNLIRHTLRFRSGGKATPATDLVSIAGLQNYTNTATYSNAT